jgi:type I restriction enzyme S subunit
MSNYRPYPKYKPSGVEWLGDVPVGWKVSRIKNVATINASKSEVSHLDPKTEISFLPMEAVGDDGSLDTSTTRPLGDVLTGYTYVRENDVLVAKITPCFENGKGCIAKGLNNGIGFATTEVVPIRPNKRSIPEFLYFLLHGLPFRKVAEGSMYGAGGQKRVSDTFVAGYAFALPPLPEQHQIAAFLDRECGKLDALQAKQERLIELLKEKRQALISHAVTKGLDPTAQLKPSGVEWLGEVPEHWKVTRLKFHVSRFEQGWSPQCEGRNKEDGEIGVLKVGCVNGGTFRVEEHKALPAELEPRLQYTLKLGDLLISRANTRELVGSAAVVDRDHDDILLCDKLYRLRFHRGVSEIFLSHFLRTSEVRQQIELDATGASASMVNIGQDCIRELNLALPPLAEQRAIVAHLDEKCGKIDQLKAKAERGIELLKERRSALISAAVTGKIDVREM